MKKEKKKAQVVGVAKDNGLRRYFHSRKSEGAVQMKSFGNQGMVRQERRAGIWPAGLSESITLSLHDFCSMHPFPSSSFLSTTKFTLSCGSPATDWLSVQDVRTCLPDPRCGTRADPAVGVMSIPRECSGIQPSVRTDRKSNSSQLALSKHQNNENSPQIMNRYHSGRKNNKITRNYLRSMASVGDLQPCSLLITFNFFRRQFIFFVGQHLVKASQPRVLSR